MAGFKDIIGHEQIIEHLQNAIGMDKVSHAYIINGPDKSGKMMLAEAFAMALQCEKHGKYKKLKALLPQSMVRSKILRRRFIGLIQLTVNGQIKVPINKPLLTKTKLNSR